MIYIGIDPASRKNGFAVCVIDTKENTAEFIRFSLPMQFAIWANENKEKLNGALFCVEDSSLQNSTFRSTGNRGEIMRKSRNAGANQAISKNTVLMLRDMFGPQNVLAISPKQKGRVVIADAVFSALVKSTGYTVTAKKKIITDDKVAFHMALRAIKIRLLHSV